MRYAQRVLWHGVALAFFISCCALTNGWSQINFKGPRPGDVYREYTRSMPPNNTEAWRVTDPNVSLTLYPQAAPFLPNPSIDLSVSDLSGAIRAEAVISMWGGHVGTTGKKVRFNGNSWITIPELGAQNGIPAGHNGECFISAPTVVVDVPLSYLRTGTNYFEGTNTGQTCYSFQWGQHGWYNLMLRIYYDPAAKSHPTGSISSIASGGTLGENPTITTSVTGGSVDRIDVLASYYGGSTDGDGFYSGYHYDYFPLSTSESSMNLRNHVGTATGSGRSVVWNTTWVPDQAAGGIKLIAHLRDASGVWYCTDEVTNVSLSRSGYFVKMYTPYDMPERAWARGDLTPFVTHVTIPSGDNLANATAAIYYIRTWNGIDGDADPAGHYRRLNSWTDGEFGANHFYSADVRTVPVNQLVQGTNTFTWYSATTAHHGMEILWPGPAILVRYGGTPSNNPPTITAHPSNQTVAEGQTATFTVGATGSGTLSYQWQKNGSNISGANGSTYTTPPTTLSDNNSAFRCVVTNNYGSATSNAATLTVTTGGGGGGTNVLTNGSFESGTSGWTFYTNGAGSFNTVSPGSNGAVAGRVSISTAGTNVQLFQYAITLEPSTQYTLSFDAYASAGRTITVSVQQHGSPYTNYGLRSQPFGLGTSWQNYSVTFTTGGFSSVVSDARLMIWLADVDVAGDQYTFDNIILSKAGGGTPTAPSITSQPANQTAAEGRTATFSVGASGTAPLTYQWQKNNTDISGATASSYTTPPVTLSDNNATFRCVVKNAYGTATSNPATLTVTPGGGGETNVLANGSFELGTSGWTFYTNGSGTFATETPGTDGSTAARITIAAEGTNVQLFQYGFTLESGTQYTLKFDGYANVGKTIKVSVQKHGSPYSSYGLNAQPFTLGTSWQTYTVTFTSGGFSGTVTDPRLMVWLADVDAAGDQYHFDNFVLSKAGSGGNTAPTITSQPQNQTVAVGQTATFSVGASGTAPLLYQWQRNNTDISGATSASYTTPPVATSDNNATFRCVVKNNYGTATSNAATLTVGGAAANVLTNPSFESGTNGWFFYTDGAGGFTTVTPGTNGTNAGRVSISSAGSNVQLYQYGFVLDANSAYQLSFDAYASAARTITVSVQKHGSPYTNYGLMSRAAALGTSWQNFSMSFTTGGFSGTVTDPRLMIWLANVDVAGDQYTFDNFVLSKAPSGSPEMMADGSVDNELPTTRGIASIYPNPFNPSTNIRYMITAPAVVTIRVYSILGQEVTTLVNAPQAAGVYSLVWDGRNGSGVAMGSGTYLVRMMATGERGEPIVSVKRMMLVK
jgi:hypothetical protein